MSTALKLLASVVLAGLFIGIVIGLGGQISDYMEQERFKNESEELAARIEYLSTQTENSEEEFQISIPEDYKLSFEGKNVVAHIGELKEFYPTEENVKGPTVESGEKNLVLKRTDDGVEIIAK